MVLIPCKARKVKAFVGLPKQKEPGSSSPLPGKGQKMNQAFSTLAFLTPFLLLTRNTLHSMAMIYSASVKYKTA